jgi:exodeoxyribonuclease VII large subunit
MKPIILTVQQLTNLIKQQIEEPFQKVSVQGEIANLKKAASGHIYFSLIETDCLLNAVLFRSQADHLSFLPKNGDSVVACGDIVLFQARGSYQLLVKSMELSGIGALLLAKQKLKTKLHSLGWFAPERKKQLPSTIQKIGVITSPTGAVLRDIVNILKRRCSTFHLVVNPVLVQGEMASQQIAKAIVDMNRHSLADVLIICRGGGSSEDLAAFDSEEVAEACFKSSIPIISAVGHETDITILDLVADLRAPTPSAAAELASKEKKDLAEKITILSLALIRSFRARLLSAKAHLDTLSRQLTAHHPSKELASRHVELNDQQESLYTTIHQLLKSRKDSLLLIDAALRSLAPQEKLLERKRELNGMFHSMFHIGKKRLFAARESLEVAKKNLFEKIRWQLFFKRKMFHSAIEKNPLSLFLEKKITFLRQDLQRLSLHVHSSNPYLPLEKGYALIKGEKEKVCSSIDDIVIGERVELIFSDGAAIAQIENKKKVQI